MIAFFAAPAMAAGLTVAWRLMGKVFLLTTAPETAIRNYAKKRNQELDLPMVEVEYLEEKQLRAKEGGDREEFFSLKHQLEQLIQLIVIEIGEDELPKEVAKEFAGTYFLTNREAAGLYNTLCIRQLGLGVGRPTHLLKEIQQKTGLSEEDIISTFINGGNSNPEYLRKVSAARLKDEHFQRLLKEGMQIEKLLNEAQKEKEAQEAA